ncbi:ABC transporter substrate-binding protein [Benzoatithermus flavus]|uniref:ABC transporter substrate-binding protein n=1 Tax=Benzoatithermus flavus TaxID=3108223 RepID=A0ABU8XU06_9PROT
MTSRVEARTTGAGGLSRRHLLQVTGTGAAALAVAGRAGFAQEAGPPLKIGSQGPFTGPASRTGAEIRNGVTLAIEDARAAGEIPVTIDGRKRDVEIVWVDGQSSPETAVKAYTDAITREKVNFFISGWHSSVAMALSELNSTYRIVHLGDLGETQFLSEKIRKDPEKYKGWFKGWPAPPVLAGLYGPPLKHFIETKAWQPVNMKAAVLVEDTDFGRGWGEAAMTSLKEAGFEVEPYDVTALDESEFGPLLLKYKAKKVSLVGMTSTGSTAVANFVKQFRQQNVKALLIAHGLTWFNEWPQLTGDASDYAVAIDSPYAISPEQKAWLAHYKERFDAEPSIAAGGISYDYARMAIKALNTAGTLDFDTLVKTIRSMSYKGVWNLYRFASEAGPNAMAPNEVMTGPFMQGFFFPMAQFMGGKAAVVYPTEFAEKPFQAPPWL